MKHCARPAVMLLSAVALLSACGGNYDDDVAGDDSETAVESDEQLSDGIDLLLGTAQQGLTYSPYYPYYPYCASAASDPDGDGWGWENNQSCIVVKTTTTTTTTGGMTCSNPDGTNSVMAAFAVAVAQELGRWNASKDFVRNDTSGLSESSYGSQQAIKLASGSDASGPIGKSRCADGKCARVQALLDMQYDQANNKVYIQGSGTTKVLLSPAALRSRMYAKWGEQKTCDAAPRNGDNGSCTTEQNKLTYVSAAAGGCDMNFTFAAKNTSGGTLQYINQLKNELKFADSSNPYINFTNLGNGNISIDPTLGLDEVGTTTTASCIAACTKISTTNIAGTCCSCSGVSKLYSKAAWSATTFLCM